MELFYVIGGAAAIALVYFFGLVDNFFIFNKRKLKKLKNQREKTEAAKKNVEEMRNNAKELHKEIVEFNKDVDALKKATK